MEQLHAKRDSWLTWSLFVCLVLALSMSLTACGKKSKSGSVGSTPVKDDDDVKPSGAYSQIVDSGLNLSHATLNGYFTMSLTVYGSAIPDTGYNGKARIGGYVKVLKDYLCMGTGAVVKAGEYKINSTDESGMYSNNGYVFNLMNAGAELVSVKDNKIKIPMVVQFVEFENYSTRAYIDGFSYNGSFYGDIAICNSNVHFAMEY